MPNRTVYLKQQKIKLDSANLLQAGGEGLVFAHGRDQALKLYHQPTPAHSAKLNYLWQHQLNKVGNGAVYWPDTAVTDDPHKPTIIGFTMPRLPQGWQPFKRLSNPHYLRQHNISLPQIVQLLRHAWQVLDNLHQHHIIVGDLNEQNIFFDPHNPQTSAWLDSDSYQFGGHPCPVALETYLDPQLYHITDFSQRPVFNSATDWYAFFVLLVKSILQVHPYGGSHPTHKTLAKRASQQLSILNGAVTYPPQARPLEVLSDPLLQHLRRVFAKGERPHFPQQLLADYAQELKACGQCGEFFPHSRPHCPHCQQRTPFVSLPAPSRQSEPSVCLYQTKGYIEAVWVQYEQVYAGQRRFRAVVREDKLYALLYAGVGGQISEMPLFAGQPGYRFAYFAGHLLVNPPHRGELLLLDVSGLEPTRLAMLTTEQFGHTAVFATTPRHLYRLANGYIMQCSVRDGIVVEEVVGTGIPNQTLLWGSPFDNTLAGVYRSFGEYTFFSRTAVGVWQEYPLALDPGESVQEMAVTFQPHGRGPDLFLQTQKQGQTFYKSSAQSLPRKPLELHECPPFHTAPAWHKEALYIPTEQGLWRQKGHIQSLLAPRLRCAPNLDLPLAPHHLLHAHDDGLLVQTEQALFLLRL
jgi:hypothetical protein